MKRLALASLVSMLSVGLYAESNYAPMVEEATILGYGTPATISISNSAWTKVPTTAYGSRSGFVVSVPASNNANMVGHLANCTSTAIATTVRPIEIIKGNGFTLFPAGNGVCLWLLSLHSGAENAHVQEIAQ